MSFRALYESSKIITSGWGTAKPGAAGQVQKGLGKKRIPISPSEWVNAFIRIKDGNTGGTTPMEFSQRKYLLRPYDTSSRRVLYLTSRQTEKSTTIANRLLELSGVRPNYTSLFVSPSAMQTKVFSVTRIDDIIEVSPALRALRDSRQTYNLLEKSFVNGSKIYLRYAFLSADRIRGLSVNSLFIDEVQDILTELIPVIEETTSRHQSPFFLYSGTPKTFDNTIEKIWSGHSTQNEWAIPCDHHSPSFWNILGIRNLGKKGPICVKCGNLLNPEHPRAQWVRQVDAAEFEGFRIPRLMVPWFVKDPEKWASILDVYERYPLANFMNEVMALSYDSGTKPITRAEVRRICDSAYPGTEESLDQYIGRTALYAGIDWGVGTDNSYTVITIGGYVRDDTKFQILFSRRYSGHMMDPDLHLPDIERLISTYRIKRVGVDFGGGFHPNKRLTSTFGPARIHQFQYTGRLPAKFVYKKDMHRFMVYRSPVMADIFTAMKHKKLMLPDYKAYEHPYIDDILSIHAEYSETLRMHQYDKPRSVPDDTFHSILYTVLASYLDVRRPDIVSPILDPSISQTAHEAAGEMRAMREMEDLAAMDDMI